MHSFEVHSDENACGKKVRLGLEQVILDIQQEMISKIAPSLSHSLLHHENILQRSIGVL